MQKKTPNSYFDVERLKSRNGCNDYTKVIENLTWCAHDSLYILSLQKTFKVR